MLINLTNTSQERAGGTSEPELDKWHKQFGARTGIGSVKANVKLLPLALSDPFEVQGGWVTALLGFLETAIFSRPGIGPKCPIST